MKTITSILHLENVDRSKVAVTVKHLKEIEDLPYSDIEFAEISSSILKLKIKYPLIIFDKSVAQFLAVLFGELAFMREFGKLTFEGLELPDEVYDWFGGPKFGIEGVKERFDVKEFPMLVAIIKPSVGPGLNKKIVEQKIFSALAGGFHAVKDDEMQGDLEFVTLAERVAIAEKNGHYIPTLNLDNTEEYEKFLSRGKIGMVLINASTIGFPLLRTLCEKTKIPILSHVAMQGVFHYSFSPKLFAFLHRLFGCDAFITPIGDVDYYRISKEGEMEMAKELTKELPIKKTLPLLTGGARLHNLEQIIAPYEEDRIPYGVVFGTLIFVSDKEPEEMASLVVKKIKEFKNRS